MDRIFDPENPNLYGYRLYRYDPSFYRFIADKLFKWWHETLWSIYGRERVVAVYLHGEQTLIGKIDNWMAKQILSYIYGK